MNIELFPASDGDAIVLTWGRALSPKRMLIDAGRASAWPAIKKAYKDLPEAERLFELLVVTHVDADHIAGVLKMLRDPECPLRFKEVWFNAYHHLVGGDMEMFGVEQGEALSDILKQAPERWNRSFGGGAVVIETSGELPRLTIEGLEITLLSPTRQKLQALASIWKTWLKSEKLDRDQTPDPEPKAPFMIPEGYESFGGRPDVESLAGSPTTTDTKAANGSSIAFAVSYGGKRLLLAGDAHCDVLAASMLRLSKEERQFDLVKLPHHGSQGNLSRPLLAAWDCRRFAISTNGAQHNHPDPEAVARLLVDTRGKKELFFNYRHEEAVIWDDEQLRTDYEYVSYYAKADEMGYIKIAV